jgi:hypothetical protein
MGVFRDRPDLLAVRRSFIFPPGSLLILTTGPHDDGGSRVEGQWSGTWFTVVIAALGMFQTGTAVVALLTNLEERGGIYKWLLPGDSPFGIHSALLVLIFWSMLAAYIRFVTEQALAESLAVTLDGHLQVSTDTNDA